MTVGEPEFIFCYSQVQIKTAKQRVVMASLYLGTGLLEQELVNCLEETLEKSLQANESPNLRVSILLDYTRGSRGRYYDTLLSSKAYFSQTEHVVIFEGDCLG